MEVPPALKLQDHAYKYLNLFGLKETERKPLTEILPDQLSHPNLSQIKEECQRSLIQERSHIHRN